MYVICKLVNIELLKNFLTSYLCRAIIQSSSKVELTDKFIHDVAGWLRLNLGCLAKTPWAYSHAVITYSRE